MPHIQAVVFDFGGVLVDWRPEMVLSRHYADEARRATIRREMLGHPDWIEIDRGTLTLEDAVPRFAARTGETDQEVVAFMTALRNSLVPKPDSVKLLRTLAARSVPLYALSNMPVETYEWLRSRHDFFGLFRGVVISAAVRLAKPEAAIFEHLRMSYGLDPSRTLFIDDVAENVTMAATLGFEALRFTNGNAAAAALSSLGLV